MEVISPRWYLKAGDQRRSRGVEVSRDTRRSQGCGTARQRGWEEGRAGREDPARLGSEAGEKPEAGRPGSRCLEQEEGVAHHVQCCE